MLDLLLSSYRVSFLSKNMADVGDHTFNQIKETVEIITEKAKNGTEKIPATFEGMAIAYASLVIMALLPIFFGAFRSVRHHKEQKVNNIII